jgi:RNA ligase (TIGR02306 family)
MADINVPVARIESVAPHPNADKLEIAQILGWQVIVGKDNWKPGDKVMYVPPDALVPNHWALEWGVIDYLHSCSDENYGRVKAIKLRGEPSFGFAVPIKYKHDGTNVASLFGIKKYEPSAANGGKNGSAPGVPVHPLLQGYTNIENFRNYPNIIQPGEMVVITEKIHGANSRVAMLEGELVVGSHKRQWGRPENESDVAENWFWYPTTIPGVMDLLTAYGRDHKQVILYGETYGRVQSMHYGNPTGLSWVAFDLLIDGKYVDWQQFDNDCLYYGVPRVPYLYSGAFGAEQLRECSFKNTCLNDTHIREGAVVKPLVERHDSRIGRVILKYLSDDYLTSKHHDQEVAA